MEVLNVRFRVDSRWRAVRGFGFGKQRLEEDSLFIFLVSAKEASCRGGINSPSYTSEEKKAGYNE